MRHHCLSSNRAFTSLAALGAVLGFATPNSEALPITGEVAFGGIAMLNNPISALATQASIPLAFGASATGSFTPSIGVGTPIAFTSPIVFGVTSGIIWSGGAGPVFTFTAASPVTASAGGFNTLGLSALGTVDDGPGGLDATAARFTMAITPTGGVLGAFGSITMIDHSPAVPDGGSTMILMGVGATFIGFCRRRFAS